VEEIKILGNVGNGHGAILLDKQPIREEQVKSNGDGLSLS